MKAGVIIDDWKLPIFEQHLTRAGFTYKNMGPFKPKTLILHVDTASAAALERVVRAANNEAAERGTIQ